MSTEDQRLEYLKRVTVEPPNPRERPSSPPSLDASAGGERGPSEEARFDNPGPGEPLPGGFARVRHTLYRLVWTRLPDAPVPASATCWAIVGDDPFALN